MAVLAGGGLLAAAALALLTRLRKRQRRCRAIGERVPRPDPATAATEVSLRVAAEPDDLDFVNSAVRSLAVLLRGRPEPLPQIRGARLTSTALELLLGAPAEASPSPYRPSADGRRWIVDRDADLPVTAQTAADVVSPLPGLVPFGRDGDGLVLLDLEALGSVALSGEAPGTEPILAWLTAELLLCAWSDHVQVTAVGAMADLGGVDPERLQVTEALDETVVSDLEKTAAGAAAEDDRGDAVLASRVDDETGTCARTPEFVVLRDVPDRALGDRLLAAIGGSGRTGVAAVAAGDWPGARWTLTCHPNGTVDVPPLGLTVRANHLDPATARSLADLFRVARQPSAPRDQNAAGEQLAGGIAADESKPAVLEPSAVVRADTRSEAPTRLSPADERLNAAVAAWFDAEDATVARVMIMGPVDIDARGPVDSNRRATATELIAYVATHGRDIDPADLDEALWPDRRVNAANRIETIARARRWLGHDADGNPHMPQARGGRLRVGPGVLLDWDLFQRLAARGAAAGPAGETDLRRAIELVRGRPFESVRRGRYAWVAATYLEQDIPAAVVDAAHRLARLQLDNDNPDGARTNARIAQTVDRYDERPWRDLIEAEHRLANTRVVRSLIANLRRELDIETDDELSEETTNLIESVTIQRA